MRRRRTLSGEERELWQIVARTVEPLRAPEPPKPEPPPVIAASPGPPPPPGPLNRKKKAAAVEAVVPILPAAPKAPPLHPMEKRAISRVARGTIAIDGRIDLHGLTQLDAHDRLRGFLFEAQSRGAKIVLVITGKGKAEDGGNHGVGVGVPERGVLRRRVPHWLAEPGMRAIVIGFQEAHATHGGGGALYVRIRKKRVGG